MKILHERLREYGWEAIDNLTPNQIADEIEETYLQRPCFEDGKAVTIGSCVDGLEDKVTGYIVDNTGYWTIYGDYDQVEGKGLVKHPEIFDSEGIPIKVGDTVYSILTNGGEPFGTSYIVVNVRYDNDDDWLNIECGHGDENVWCFDAEDLVHHEPDTQEKVDRDSLKSNYVQYWGCENTLCTECPARKDGKKPSAWYDVVNCDKAMRLDLLRRQREIDKHMINDYNKISFAVNTLIQLVDDIFDKYGKDIDDDTLSNELNNGMEYALNGLDKRERTSAIILAGIARKGVFSSIKDDAQCAN